jgi:hypothetical protein
MLYNADTLNAVIQICVQDIFFPLGYQPLLFSDIIVIYMLPESNEKTNDNNGTEKVTSISVIQV